MCLFYLDIFHSRQDQFPIYHIDRNMESSATRVMFVSSEQPDTRLCLKIWKPIKDDLYDTERTEQRLLYLLQGWKYNCISAPGVHLGLAPIEFLGENIVQLGRLIRKPNSSNVWPFTEYVLVMKQLNEDWQLDKQLAADKFGTRKGMKFLARKIARLHKKFVRMHRKLNISSHIFGTYEVLSAKLVLNVKCYERALDKLKKGERDIEKYRDIIGVLKQGLDTYSDLFQQRCEKGHIIHCHGDLKATNLWIYPRRFLGIKFMQLLALDCVDFKDEFCHIDTLSDIAMLAIDIEMHLLSQLEEPDERAIELEMAQHFLLTYLHEMHEDQKEVQPILEYYMLEKSIVCAFMSILYDQDYTLGQQYLDIALIHTHHLQDLLFAQGQWPTSSHITSSRDTHSR